MSILNYRFLPSDSCQTHKRVYKGHRQKTSGLELRNPMLTLIVVSVLLIVGDILRDHL